MVEKDEGGGKKNLTRNNAGTVFKEDKIEEHYNDILSVGLVRRIIGWLQFHSFPCVTAINVIVERLCSFDINKITVNVVVDSYLPLWKRLPSVCFG